MNHRHASYFVLAWCAGLLGAQAPLGAQDPARLDASRITSAEFAAERFGPARWLDGSHYATLEPDATRTVLELVQYEAASGAREVLVGKARLRRPDGEFVVIEDYAFSPDAARLLVFTESERVWRQNTRGEYYVVELRGEKPPQRLGGTLPKSSLMFAKFAPQGDRVAYVSGNNLYVENIASGGVTALTTDGSRTTINGTFDWVYEEEFDCRDGFRWSPDGTRLAYWQLDCTGVGEFYMVDNLSDRYARILPVQYPKAGTTNSSCKVGVVAATGGDTVWMKTPGDPRETYVPRMEWHPRGEELMLQWLPRAQNHLVVYGADAATGGVRVVHEERDAAYIDVREDFRWADGGERFFWTTDAGSAVFGGDDRTGYRQCGTLLWDTRGKQVLVNGMAWTRGFDVMGVAYVDLPNASVYVEASPGNATQKALWQAGPQGSKQLTPNGMLGWHDYQVSPDGSWALHTYSRFDTPPVVDVVRLPSHESVRVLVDNAGLRERYAAVARGKNEFFAVDLGEGVSLDGWVMYPPDFDAARKWPVLFHVYGEPWSQTVKDTWSLGHHLFHRWLTQQGYVVMSLDARGTPAPKGRDWRKALYQNIGVVSTADWHAAVESLRARHAWMDASRQAVWGWSGGGAMTLNLLMRCPDLFAAGMSVAPVTDISLYDTIYQERYCGDPREVPEVYRRCSPITYAANLKAKLLLVHGT
ncbi:MAG: hypothetical protein RL398_3385, partial [Planctomycetota bacterium]